MTTRSIASARASSTPARPATRSSAMAATSSALSASEREELRRHDRVEASVSWRRNRGGANADAYAVAVVEKGQRSDFGYNRMQSLPARGFIPCFHGRPALKGGVMHRSRTSPGCDCGLVCHDSRDRWLARSSRKSISQRFAPIWHSCAPRRPRRRCSPWSRPTPTDTDSRACCPRSRTPMGWRSSSSTRDHAARASIHTARAAARGILRGARAGGDRVASARHRRARRRAGRDAAKRRCCRGRSRCSSRSTAG